MLLWPSWLRRAAVNRKIGGSIPPGSVYVHVAQWIARVTSNHEVVGSTPTMDSLMWYKFMIILWS